MFKSFFTSWWNSMSLR